MGSLNPIKDADVQINGGAARKASVGLWYPDGKLAMFMSQTLNDINNGVVVDLRLNDEDLISRIDLCMPELFNFRYYAGPFRVDEEI